MPEQPRAPRRRTVRRSGRGSTTPAAVLWQGTARNRVLWLVSLAGLAVLALGIDLAVEPGSGRVATIAAVAGCIAAGLIFFAATMAFSRVRVRIDRTCVEVRCGHLGVPRRRIPLVQVAACTTERVTPRNWGGWGARWFPERGDAVVVRRGPGLVLTLGDGKRFTVTVDDADGARRALQQLLPAEPDAA